MDYPMKGIWWFPLIMSAPCTGDVDNLGSEFVVMFMENFINGDPHELEIFITTYKSHDVSVHVSSPKWSSPKVDQSFNITTGQVKMVKFSHMLRMVGTGKSSKGILVRATDEIALYGFNKEHLSTDGFLGLPTDALGTDYFAITYYPPTRQTEIGIAAVHNNTQVYFKLKDSLTGNITYNNIAFFAGDTLIVELDEYETFQMQSSTDDLTGTRILSTYPIAVFSGNKKTRVAPDDIPTLRTSQDHLVSQLPPVDVWGNTFVTVPTPGRLFGDVVKIIASQANTSVNISGFDRQYINDGGGYIQARLPAGQYSTIQADKPVMMVLFSITMDQSETEGDPSMTIIPWLEQFNSKYTFTTPQYSVGSYTNYILLVIEEQYKNGLIFDGNNAYVNGAAIWHSFPGLDTDYVGTYVNITEGSHHIEHSNSNASFGVYLYGKANWESYGLPAGMKMVKINECPNTNGSVPDGVDNDCDGLIDEEICGPSGTDDDTDGKIDEDCGSYETTVSTTATTGQSVSTTVQITATTVPTVITTVPTTTTSANVPTTSTTVPTTSTTVPTTSTNVPTTSAIVSTTFTSVSTSSAAVAITSTAVPLTSTAVPTTSSTVPTTSTTVPTTSTNVPTTSATVSSTFTSVSTTSTTVPTTSTAVPITFTTVPPISTTVPSTSTASTSVPIATAPIATIKLITEQEASHQTGDKEEDGEERGNNKLTTIIPGIFIPLIILAMIPCTCMLAMIFEAKKKNRGESRGKERQRKYETGSSTPPTPRNAVAPYP